MKKTSLSLVALALILFGIFGGGAFDLLDRPTPNPPNPEPEVSILNIDKPTVEVLNKVKKFSDLITDPTDRAKIAIFNYEFANALLTYDTDLQQLNDVYVLAGKKFFQSSLVGKYKSLPEMITQTIEEITGSKNHVLSVEEKQSLNEHFLGIAWALIQKV